jgi:hypothetical protein
MREPTEDKVMHTIEEKNQDSERRTRNTMPDA